MDIRPAEVPADLAEVQSLFREYANSLGIDLSFQDFEAELAGLPGKYAPPAGRLLLAWDSAGSVVESGRGRFDAPGRKRDFSRTAVGCIALRRIDDSTCEMKRLYVRPQARGTQLGRKLVECICDEARRAGYSRICLDTLPSMVSAQKLYRSLGFEPIEPYVFNPVPGTHFMALDLKTLRSPAVVPAR
jgi:ribosomal protein S18 acetylase RimI-like enzyme